MGVLSALPIVNVGNACCCLWVVGGGVVAAYVFQQNQSTPIEPGDAALAGLLAGLFGAVVTVVVSLPLDLIVGPFYRELAQRALDMAGSMPPDLRDMLDRVSRRGPPTLAFLVVAKSVVPGQRQQLARGADVFVERFPSHKVPVPDVLRIILQPKRSELRFR